MKMILSIMILFWANLVFSKDNGSIKWTFETNADIKSTPAIAPDGTIYVGGGYLYALNSDGTFKWKFTPFYEQDSVGVSGSPAIGADGTIYFGNKGTGMFYAVNADGTEKWSRDITQGWILSSPAISPDGTIIITTSMGEMIALNPDDGSEKWNKTRNASKGSPAIDAKGTIIQPSGDYLKAISKSGEIIWKARIGDGSDSSPAIDADGTIYVGSSNRFVYAVNPDGSQKWLLKLNGKITKSAVIGLDGTIYILTDENMFYAINSDGTVKWTFDKIASSFSGPTITAAIGSDSLIYIGGTSTGFKYTLFAINPDSGTVNWETVLDNIPVTSPTITMDKTILVAGSNKLYAVNCGSAGLGNTPWPKLRKDYCNTGLTSVTVVSVEETAVNSPLEYNLSDAYPNPFNPTTNFNFSIKKSENVNISVYNTLGQMVQNLVNEYKNAGSYHVNWNAANFGSGIYFIKINSGSFTQTKKVILLK